MITKRIAISFLTVVGILALVAALAVAQFGDQAFLTGNTMTTGNANLQIAEDLASPGTFSSSIGGLTGVDLAPGQSASKLFWLKNNSDSDISLAVSAAVGNVTGDLASSKVDLSISCGGPAVVGTLATFPTDTIVTIPHGVVEGNPVLCNIEATLNGTTEPADTDKTISFDVTFTGTQTP